MLFLRFSNLITHKCFQKFCIQNKKYKKYTNTIQYRGVREGSVHRGRQMVPGHERGRRVVPQGLVRAAAHLVAAAGREKGLQGKEDVHVSRVQDQRSQGNPFNHW